MARQTIRIPKNAPGVRAFLTLLLLAAGGFFVVMGVLSSHRSALTCTASPVRCAHHESYPLGVVFDTELAPFSRVGLREKSGQRGTSLNLTLHHDDGSSTEYPGVGTNGDRAAEVAEQLNAFLVRPSAEATFDLRSGSIPLAVFLLLLGFGALLLVPSIFNAVKITCRGDRVTLGVGRHPLPARTHEIALADMGPIQLRPRVLAGRATFALELMVRDREPIDLGITLADEPAARSKAAEIEAKLAPLRAIP